MKQQIIQTKTMLFLGLLLMPPVTQFSSTRRGSTRSFSVNPIISTMAVNCINESTFTAFRLQCCD